MVVHDYEQQLQLVDEALHDPRKSVPTGFSGLDSLLRRGGLLPGNLVLLAGRTGTRKSTVIENMVVRMATEGVPVALVGLDEQPWQYTVSLMSVKTGRSRDWIEQVWDEPEGREVKREWKDMSRGRIALLSPRKPDPQQLVDLVTSAGVGYDEAPKVVFVDYLNKLSRDKQYGWQENNRIPRLVEELAELSTDTGIIFVVLHQLGRNDEFGGTNNRNNGHIPVTLAQLKYGGEEDADIVLGTYRPAKDPLGQMSMDAAKVSLGDRFDEDTYWEAVGRVKKHKRSTFLQVLKNRPGTHEELRGIELLSPWDDALTMVEKEADEPAYEELEEDDEASV